MDPSEFQLDEALEPTALSSTAQSLHLLNEEPGEPTVLDFGNEQAVQAPLGTLINDDRTHALISQFLPESMLELQNIGLVVADLVANGTLASLANLIPVRVSIRPPGLTSDLMLLVAPYPLEQGQVRLKTVPFLRTTSAMPLTEGQKKATDRSSPFWTLKRAVYPLNASEIECQRQQLWKEFTATKPFELSLFDEIIRRILHEPSKVEALLAAQSWTETDLENFTVILDRHFPWQVAFFTGIGFLFYPLNQLGHFPAWHKLVAQPVIAD